MDDETPLLNIVSTLLRKLGYETEQAVNGEEALKLYSHALDKGRPFAAVILDLAIQNGMGGEETMTELQKIDPHVVAIISSGYTDSPLMREYQNYGFKGCVPKPFEIKTLAACLDSILAPHTPTSAHMNHQPEKLQR